MERIDHMAVPSPGKNPEKSDLMMTTVLRILRDTDLVAREPKLKAYQERCEARPAFPACAARSSTALQN